MSDDKQSSFLWEFALSLIPVGLLLCVDVVAMGSFLFSFLVCPLWFLVTFIVAIVKISRRVGNWRVSVARAAIPLVTFLLVMGNALLQTWIARSNAVTIVLAAERYRDRNGTFPRRLEDLVPTYLPYVPPAKYAGLGRFEYRAAPGSHTLLWTSVPPFLRCTYVLENPRLTCLD
jgi:hypothetical protein